MLSLTASIGDFSDTQNAYILTSGDIISGSSYKLNFPEIMATIPIANPYQKSTGTSTGVFKNSKSCMPAISTSVTIQNYLTTKSSYSTNPTNDPDVAEISKFSKVKVDFESNSYRDRVMYE